MLTLNGLWGMDMFRPNAERQSCSYAFHPLIYASKYIELNKMIDKAWRG